MKGIQKLLSLVAKYKGLVALNMLCNVLAAIFTIMTVPVVVPIFQLFFEKDAEPLGAAPEFSVSNINEVIQYHLLSWIQEAGDEQQALAKICILLISLFFLKNLFQYLSLVFVAPIKNGVVKDLRQKMFHKIAYSPMGFFTEERKGDVIARMSVDVQEVEWSILQTLEKLVRDPIIVLGMLGYMLMVSVNLTGFVFIMLLFTGLIIGGLTSRLKRQSGAVQRSLAAIISTLEESLSGTKVIKAFTAEKAVEDRFEMHNEKYRRQLTRLLWRRDVASPLSELLGVVAVCVLFVYGAQLVASDAIQAESFISYLMAFFYMITPSKNISSAYSNLQKGLAAYDRINVILSIENHLINSEGHEIAQPLEKHIKVDDVSFAYSKGGQIVLENISLTIPKGKTIALVGTSGSGKSTLADLLLRLYDPTDGKILFDDTPLNKYKLHTLRSQFGVVTQEPFLFNATVAENIAFGGEETDRRKIEEAAKLAHAHDFIAAMPDGYDSNVGDAGQKLSGGQRQRIALARAILHDPSVLILDEATSALDSESEMAVQAALQEVLKNRTAVIIAHRLSTIQHADEIIVLQDGKIVESGNHSQLIARGGEYQKFVELQRM